MLRFLPDSWLEGLMRPFLLGEPVAGLYYEDGAPDWRFLVLAVVLAIALLSGRFKAQAGTEQRRMILLVLATFYVWTFTIGNGRYFIVGLVAAGPLLVMAWQWLPGSRSFRWLLLVGLMLVQANTVATMYRPGAWNLVGWRQGPAVYVSPSPVRNTPAVFVTVTAISYSILVPHFHPASRWVNLGGQVDITPDRPEYTRTRQLLDSPLPLYLVSPADQGPGGPVASPSELMWPVIKAALAEHGLEPAEATCSLVLTNLLPHGAAREGDAVRPGGFWLCPVQHAKAAPASGKPPARAMDDVFAHIESYCPRFFPPGQSVTKRYADHWLRYYLGTDTRIFVDDAGFVSYKYFRHFTPTVVGTVADVRADHFEFRCEKLQGRYQPPWSRD